MKPLIKISKDEKEYVFAHADVLHEKYERRMITAMRILFAVTVVLCVCLAAYVIIYGLVQQSARICAYVIVANIVLAFLFSILINRIIMQITIIQAVKEYRNQHKIIE